MRFRVFLVLVVLALTAPAALAWTGRPTSPPPKPPNSGAPPPAWIETQAKAAWLAYGSYCWTRAGKASCVDMIPPQARPDLPIFTAKSGRIVRVHLGFRAKSVSVSLGGRAARATLDATRRIVSWSATRGGILTVFARPAAGDASYVVRLRVR